MLKNSISGLASGLELAFFDTIYMLKRSITCG